jgi:hypothetical protein
MIAAVVSIIAQGSEFWRLRPESYIASLALLVSISALLINKADRKHELHLGEILSAMRELESICHECLRRVEAVLLFRCHDAVDGDHTDCHRQTTLRLSDALAQAERLENLVQPLGKEIFRSIKDWHTTLTMDYPITAEEEALRPSDARFSDLHLVQRRLDNFLSEVRTGCLSRKIKFWKS